MLLILFGDLDTLQRSYQSYGRYATFLASVFGMVMLGDNTHRAKPVLSLLLLILANAYLLTSKKPSPLKTKSE